MMSDRENQASTTSSTTGTTLSSADRLQHRSRALSFSFSPASPQHKEASAEEKAGTTNTVAVASASSQPSMSSLPESLPSGIPMPKPLKLDNVAVNWTKFKRA